MTRDTFTRTTCDRCRRVKGDHELDWVRVNYATSDHMQTEATHFDLSLDLCSGCRVVFNSFIGGHDA